MTRYIFNGGGPAADGGTSFYTTLLKDVPDGGTLLLCYFASRDTKEKQQENFAAVSKKVAEVCIPRLITTVFAESDSFMSQVEAADAVSIRGGSTDTLISKLAQYPNLHNAFTGKTIAGTSAGAYALSAYYSSHYENTAAKGLGVVPVRVITHCAGEKMQPKPSAIKALEQTATNLPLITLREGEWAEFVIE